MLLAWISFEFATIRHPKKNRFKFAEFFAVCSTTTTLSSQQRAQWTDHFIAGSRYRLYDCLRCTTRMKNVTAVKCPTATCITPSVHAAKSNSLCKRVALCQLPNTRTTLRYAKQCKSQTLPSDGKLYSSSNETFCRFLCIMCVRTRLYASRAFSNRAACSFLWYKMPDTALLLSMSTMRSLKAQFASRFVTVVCMVVLPVASCRQAHTWVVRNRYLAWEARLWALQFVQHVGAIGKDLGSRTVAESPSGSVRTAPASWSRPCLVQTSG